MNKILGLILLIIAIIGISGCVQVEQLETVEEAPIDTSKIEPLEGIEPEEVEIAEPEAEEPETERLVEAAPAGPWCDPTDLNIFVDPYIPISEISIFVNEDYDKEFGPIKVTQLFQEDELIGYVELDLPANLRYSDLFVQGRFVNGNNIVDDSIISTEDGLIKYANYHYQVWKGAKAVNLEDIVFETKLTYIINGVEQTQCESYSVPVVELENAEVSKDFDFKTITYSRSQIFVIEGNFSENFYNKISRDFAATFQAEHISDPEVRVDAKLNLLNKVVCVGHTCSLKGEVTLPRRTIDAYSVYDQWCSDTFKRRLRVDRGVAQPFYVGMGDELMGALCNKLKVGI